MPEGGNHGGNTGLNRAVVIDKNVDKPYLIPQPLYCGFIAEHGQMDQSISVLKINRDSHTVYSLINIDQCLEYNKTDLWGINLLKLIAKSRQQFDLISQMNDESAFYIFIITETICFSAVYNCY